MLYSVVMSMCLFMCIECDLRLVGETILQVMVSIHIVLMEIGDGGVGNCVGARHSPVEVAVIVVGVSSD